MSGHAQQISSYIQMQMPEAISPFSLAPWFSPRPWGAMSLEPWFHLGELTEPIGEAWLTGPESTVRNGPFAQKTLASVVREAPASLLGDAQPCGDFPLLIKLIFPTDKLSIQVHPDDAMAHSLGHARGKTECWYVLEADPDASVSLGLREGATPQAIRNAIHDNTLENWLQQVPVQRGDMVFVPAGTVHAIGPGVVLLEVQQQSDLTYRMYDYGRPRELHVETSLAAMRLETAAGIIAPRKTNDGLLLIETPYFTVIERHCATGEAFSLQSSGVPITLVLLEGDASLRGPTSAMMMTRGEATVVPPNTARAQVLTTKHARWLEVTPGTALW